MATNLKIDEKLLSTAQKLGKLETKKATVNQALLEFIQNRKQKNIIDLFGTIEFEKGYSYKLQRKRK